MSRSSIDVYGIRGVQTNSDETGIPYVTLTVETSEAGEEVTIRMNVNHTGTVASKLAEAEEEAVEMLHEAGYTEWPSRFILPEYPPGNETRTGR